MDFSSILNPASGSNSPAPERSVTSALQLNPLVLTPTHAPTTAPPPPPSPSPPPATLARAHHSPRNSYSRDHRTSTSYGTPREPSPPLEHTQIPTATPLSDLATTTLPLLKSLPQFQPSRDGATTAYGRDTLQIPHGNDSVDTNNEAQNEPDNVRDSPLAKSSAASVDTEAAKAIAAAPNEHGTCGVRPKSQTGEQPSPEPMSSQTRKRPAPAKAVPKKGVVRKPPAKKRKVEDGEDKSVDADTRRSTTPLKTPAFKMGKSKSKSNTPHLASSPAPDHHSSPATEEPVEEEGGEEEMNDGELYCVCRKPDNHSWMIACDGGCDDWFHGRCVQMKEEQGDLIDKYICPNCERAGKGCTSWKPCCRRMGCNKPAKIDNKPPSKYCSTECGRAFMMEKLGLDKTAKLKAVKEKARKRRQGNATDHDYNEDEEDLGPRGGVLRPGDVKALVDKAKDVEHFRSMGDGVPSPPPTASADKTVFDTNGHGDATHASTPLTAEESAQIDKLSTQHDALLLRKALLRDREKLVRLVVEHVNGYAERQGVKPKDICGYDSRLAWSEGEFARWRDSPAGAAAMDAESLDALANGDSAAEKGNGDVDMAEASTADANGGANGSGRDEAAFCARKRCEQHKQWQKVALNDIRAELQDCQSDMNRLAQGMREIREQAGMRWRAETGGLRGREGGVGGLEGWVEMV